MITAITILSFLCLLLLFIKLEWGLGLYLLYYFLVPFCYLYLGGFIIGENLLYLIFLVVLCVWSKNKGGIKKSTFSLLTPFFFLFLIQAVIIPFHFSNMPIIDQLNAFRVDIMSLFLPLVILSLVCCRNNNAIVFTSVMYVSIAVATLYGLFLISIPGQNPYIDAINPLLEYELRDQEKVLEEGIRVFGYVSSVYPHVTEYGYFLIFSSVFLVSQFKRDTTIIPKILLGLVLVNVIVCGSRSVLMSECVVLLVYLFFNRHFKTLIAAGTILLVIILLLNHFMPEFMLLLSSIGDETAEGSSINLRIRQFEGCMKAIESNPVFGLGYSWSGWYCTTIGRHPTMLSFESLLIMILCNNGIMGLFIWGTMVFLVYKSIKSYFKENIVIKRTISLLLVGYFSYTFFTGDYGTFRAMMVFYSILLANEINHQSKFQNKQMAIQLKENASTSINGNLNLIV